MFEYGVDPNGENVPSGVETTGMMSVGNYLPPYPAPFLFPFVSQALSGLLYTWPDVKRQAKCFQ